MTQVAKMFTHRVVYLTLCPLLAEALRPAGKRDEAADGSIRAPGYSLSKGREAASVSAAVRRQAYRDGRGRRGQSGLSPHRSHSMGACVGGHRRGTVLPHDGQTVRDGAVMPAIVFCLMFS
jgi:hypothetical protein